MYSQKVYSTFQQCKECLEWVDTKYTSICKCEGIIYKRKNDPKGRAKGVKKCVIKSNLKHEVYVTALFNKKITYAEMNTLRSYNHQIYTTKMKKVALSPYDDKVYVLDDGINTYNYGHYKISSNQ